MTGMIVHASAVAVAGRGCLITGAAGSGKSTLALKMISAGGTLIADDRTVVTPDHGTLILSAPGSIAGQIEARGIGLIRLATTSAPLALIVDLDRASTARLPAPRYRHLLGSAHPVILGRGRNGLAAILRVVLDVGIEALE